MSNFRVFSPLQNGNPRPASAVHIAETTDSVADLLVAGYMDDKVGSIQGGDLVYVKHSSDVTWFRVSHDTGNNKWNLVKIGWVQYYSISHAGGSASFSLSLPGLSDTDEIMVMAESMTTIVPFTARAAINQVDVDCSADPGASTFKVWLSR